MEKTKQEIKKEIKQEIEKALAELDTYYNDLYSHLTYYLLATMQKDRETTTDNLKLFKEYVSLFTKKITDIVNLFYSSEYLDNIDNEYKDEVIEELVNLSAISLKVYQLYKNILETKHDFSNVEIIHLRFILDTLIDLKVDINEILYIPLRELEDF